MDLHFPVNKLEGGGYYHLDIADFTSTPAESRNFIAGNASLRPDRVFLFGLAPASQ